MSNLKNRINIFINELFCPQCQTPLTYDFLFEHEGEECGYLNCNNCFSSTPFVLGFPLFNETQKNLDANNTSLLNELVSQMAPGEGHYEQYIGQKLKRGIFEVYAAFQPFNESVRSINPLVDAWRKHLKPGDLIVDTWCRTGWSGEWLAALFPQQRILSFWQGNSSVLGYRGFFYWLNSKRRSTNLEIIFSAANAPFPIRSERAMLVHSYDSLHRNDLQKFTDECLRMAKKQGILCFPHIHLDNNKPDPFFERGGVYRRGNEYKDYFQRRLEKDGRKALVLSEISMFQRDNDIILNDEANTDHYNGLLLIAEENWYRQPFTNCVERNITGECRLVPNPLVNVNPLTGEAYPNKQALNDSFDYLLGRHPVYDKLIHSKLPAILTGEELALIAVAETGENLQKCAQILNRNVDEIVASAHALASKEIVTALPLSKTAFSLQHFHLNNHTLFPRDFLSCWSKWFKDSPQSPFLFIEGEQLSVEEVSQVLVALCRFFQKCDNASTKELAIVGDLNAERLMTLMAAWSCGYTAQLCEEQNIPSTASLVISDQGIPGNWKNITLSQDKGLFIGFWSVIEEFADSEIELPNKNGQASTLNVMGNELPWYRVSSMLTSWLV